MLAVVLLVGCGDDDTAGQEAASPAEQQPASPAEQEPASPAPPPDAGTQAGHGADPGLVAVPDSDSSPPKARITLARPGGGLLATAPQDTGAHTVTLDEPSLRGTTTGRDANGGVARVRVSIREEIDCRDGERTYRRLRTRYFPPPQVERIRSNPGARLPTSARRSLRLSLSEGRCAPGRLAAVHGELWGEAINGSGLEAVTPHLKFAYQAD
jgi:hypothetical protein